MVHLFSSPEYAKFWVFSGTCVSLANSHCHSVGFCVAFCAVPVLISWAIRSKAYISTAKYKHLSLFWKLCWNYFCWEQNEMEKNWWRKCQGGKGTSVPVKIQIWVWHSGYKSESGIVESSVSKSSACCQYCHFCLWSVAKNWKYSNFSIVLKIKTFFF